jgi:AcrR family transcriptional regulator
MADRSKSNLDRSAEARATQRSRLIAGIVAVANRDGYAATTVSAVIKEAKVSKPTFYEYFKDRDDCFIAAIGSVHTRLLGLLAGAVSDPPPEQAATAAVRALLKFANSEPALMRFIATESLAGASAILDARDEGVAKIAQLIDRRLGQAPPRAPTPDIAVALMIGGLYRLVGARARRGERLTDSELQELLQWIDEYNVPCVKRRWHTLQPSTAFASAAAQTLVSPGAPQPPLPGRLRAPEPLPPGRPTLSEADVAANQRLRIVLAAARLANEKGLATVTVAEIAKQAQVDLRVFYSLFAKKQDVFFAVQEHGFNEGTAVAAATFFSGETWPDRMWTMGVAFHRFLEANPQFTRFGFVESYTAGPDVARRADEGTLNVTIFLQEGLQFASKPTLPSPVAMHALVLCHYENVYRQARGSDSPKFLELFPNIMSIWLCPFLGPTETNRFVDEHTRVASPSQHDRRPPA